MRTILRAAALAAVLSFPILAARFSYSKTVTVSVGTSATILAASGFSFVEICNRDASKTLYWSWDDAAVTISTGRPLDPLQCVQFVDLGSDQVLRGVTTAGTVDVRVVKGVGG